MATINKKNEIAEQCKGVHCVDLDESFQTHIFLQNLVSIQPRTSPVKFAASREAAEAADGDVARGGVVLAGVWRPQLYGSRDPTNFRGLILGCIEAKFCN